MNIAVLPYSKDFLPSLLPILLGFCAEKRYDQDTAYRMITFKIEAYAMGGF